MRPRLLHHDRDLAFDGAPASRKRRAPEVPHSARVLAQDLELDTLVAAMARGDPFVGDVCERILLDPLVDPASIRYRQQVLRDCLAHPDVVRQLYALASSSIERARKVSWGFMPRRPEAIVRHSHDVFHTFLASFRLLRRLADEHAEHFAAPGFTAFFATIRRELDDAFLAEVEQHLHELRFEEGVWSSARLGSGNRGSDYVLRRPARPDLSAWARLWRWWRRPSRNGVTTLTYRLHPRDEVGLRALSEVRDRALEGFANVLAQATDHVLGYFHALRAETAFYVGCLNLSERLRELGATTCMPEPRAWQEGARAGAGLFDPCLTLRVGHPVVDNDLAADGAGLVIITGANQGGKTTFLRSVGLAQLMMQSGLFVAARSYRASAATGVFTHFKREEDATMTSGKLDEELARMSLIADALTPGSLLLLNESFAATNEREGSEIARQIVQAVTEAGAQVCFVTHLTDFARDRFERDRRTTRFLRAERQPDGTRTFKLRAGAPERTSHGVDLYLTIFDGDDASAGPAAQDGAATTKAEQTGSTK